MSFKTYMVCDHSGCGESGPRRHNERIQAGWTETGRYPQKHYCQEHSIGRMPECLDCGRPMRSWNRLAEEFPGTVAKGKDSTRCSNCGPMTVRQREIELDRAAQTYYRFRPLAEQYIDDNTGALSALMRNGATDLREMVGV